MRKYIDAITQLFEAKLDITAIIKKAIKRSGYSTNALCSGGRCYEFRDDAIALLAAHGINAYPTESIDWIRYDSIKFKKPVGWAETNNLEENNHAWIYYNGKHYDALNPEGVSRPSLMKFFQDTANDYHKPDEEEQAYQLETHKTKYDPKIDQFVKIKKTNATTRTSNRTR